MDSEASGTARTSFCISFLGGSIALRPAGGGGSSGTETASACILTTLTGAYGRRCAGRSGLRCCSEIPKPDAAARRHENASVHLSVGMVETTTADEIWRLRW